MLNALKEYVEFDEFSSIHKRNFSGMDQAARTQRSAIFTDWDSTTLDSLGHRTGELSGSLPADHNLQPPTPFASDEAWTPVKARRMEALQYSV